MTGSNPTDGPGVKTSPSAPPSDPPGADGRPFASNGSSSKTTEGGDSYPLSPISNKRQKASALLLLSSQTPGLANEEEEEEEEEENVGGNNSKSGGGGGTATTTSATDVESAAAARLLLLAEAEKSGFGSDGGSSGECRTRLLFSGAAAGIESLKVDDDDDEHDDEEIAVGSKEKEKENSIGFESRDDAGIQVDGGREITIGGIGGSNSNSSAASTILQTLLLGGGEATSAITATTAKNLGHIGDGRRTAKAKVGSDDGIEDESAKAKAKPKAKKTSPLSAKANGIQEMPIQMMTSRRIVTKPPAAQRLSRELRGLTASSSGDIENVHPNTSTSNSNAKKGGGGGGKPFTRSKIKLQQQKQKQSQKSVPPHLLQEHPSVRNKPTASSTKTKTKIGTKASSSGGGGGLTSVLRNRAAQQAASPADSIVPTPSHLATPDNPRIVTINDCRVTMIDDETKVFVIDAVTPEMCDRIRTMTDDYVWETALTNPTKQTWRTLYTYTKMDLPCGEVPGLMKQAVEGIMRNVVTIVGAVYGNKKAAAKLKPRSWKEPHLLHYQVLPGKPEHLGIEMHYDGCDVTWSLMLSENDEYEGGGTYIRCLRKTIMLKQGQILVHPGELYHKGNHITSGTRSMIVTFMDGYDPGVIDASRANDDKDEYAEDVFFA